MRGCREEGRWSDCLLTTLHCPCREVAPSGPEQALPAFPGRRTAREQEVAAAAPLEQAEATEGETRKRSLPASSAASSAVQEKEEAAAASSPARKRPRGVIALGREHRAAPSIRSEPEPRVVPAVWRDARAETPPGSPIPGSGNSVAAALKDGLRVEAPDEADAEPELGASAAPSSPRVDAPSSPVVVVESGDEAEAAARGAEGDEHGQRRGRKSRKRKSGAGTGEEEGEEAAAKHRRRHHHHHRRHHHDSHSAASETRSASAASGSGAAAKEPRPGSIDPGPAEWVCALAISARRCVAVSGSLVAGDSVRGLLPVSAALKGRLKGEQLASFMKQLRSSSSRRVAVLALDTGEDAARRVARHGATDARQSAEIVTNFSRDFATAGRAARFDGPERDVQLYVVPARADLENGGAAGESLRSALASTPFFADVLDATTPTALLCAVVLPRKWVAMAPATAPTSAPAPPAAAAAPTPAAAPARAPAPAPAPVPAVPAVAPAPSAAEPADSAQELFAMLQSVMGEPSAPDPAVAAAPAPAPPAPQQYSDPYHGGNYGGEGPPHDAYAAPRRRDAYAQEQRGARTVHAGDSRRGSRYSSGGAGGGRYTSPSLHHDARASGAAPHYSSYAAPTQPAPAGPRSGSTEDELQALLSAQVGGPPPPAHESPSRRSGDERRSHSRSHRPGSRYR